MEQLLLLARGHLKNVPEAHLALYREIWHEIFVVGRFAETTRKLKEDLDNMYEVNITIGKRNR